LSYCAFWGGPIACRPRVGEVGVGFIANGVSQKPTRVIHPLGRAGTETSRAHFARTPWGHFLGAPFPSIGLPGIFGFQTVFESQLLADPKGVTTCGLELGLN
jgi:hypothetical protein